MQDENYVILKIRETNKMDPKNVPRLFPGLPKHRTEESQAEYSHLGN
jgi:hypothetical protein